MGRSRILVFSIMAASMSLLVTIAILLQIYPLTIISGDNYIFYRQWQYILDSLSLTSLCYSIVFSAAIVALPIILRSKSRALQASTLILATIALNCFVYNPMFHGWTLRVASFNMENGLINPFFNKGMQMGDMSGYPRQHYDLASRGYFNAILGERRLTTYPPGLPMLHHVIKKIVHGSSAFLSGGILMAGDKVNEIDLSTSPETKACCAFSALIYMLSASAIPVLVYLMCLGLRRSDGIALQAGALSAMMPSLHLYASSEGALIAVMALLTMLLVLAGAKMQSRLVFYLGGIFGGSAMFFSYAMLPVLFLCGLVIVLWIREGRPGRQWESLVCWIGGGISVIIVGFFFDYNALKMLFVALGNNRSFYSEGRAYLISTLANVSETALFMGPLLLFYAVMGTGRSAARFFSMLRRGAADNSLRIPAPLTDIYAVAVGLTFVVLIFSGGVRGEVGRNLLPMFALFLVCIPGTPYASGKYYLHTALASAFHLIACSLMFELIFGLWV